ncbi:N-acetylmuramoyl-L-alanine amidase family protein [Lacinutrix salivirga]
MQTQRLTYFLSFIIVLTASLLFNTINAQSTNQFVVVLDAGHGGHDSGNVGNGYKESDIALKITLEVGKALEKNKDIKVIYTRKKDEFLKLRERAAIANKADADLFISIHCNAHHSQAYGTETFVLGVANTQRNFDIAKKENEVILLEEDYEKHYEGFDPDAPESLIGLTLQQEDYVDQSITLAGIVETYFVKKSKRKSRGVKQASLWVLHNTYMPSVLIEVGFLTNKKEGAYLNTSNGRSKMATSIIKAIEDYKKALDQNVGDIGYIVEDDEVIDESLPKDIINNTVFKVQIAASSKKLEPKSYNFKGLKDISREKEGDLYKYFYGYTSDYNLIKKLQEKAKKRGYKTSFIAAYRDGVRIPLDQALKSSAN